MLVVSWQLDCIVCYLHHGSCMLVAIMASRLICRYSTAVQQSPGAHWADHQDEERPAAERQQEANRATVRNDSITFIFKLLVDNCIICCEICYIMMVHSVITIKIANTSFTKLDLYMSVYFALASGASGLWISVFDGWFGNAVDHSQNADTCVWSWCISWLHSYPVGLMGNILHFTWFMPLKTSRARILQNQSNVIYGYLH